MSQQAGSDEVRRQRGDSLEALTVTDPTYGPDEVRDCVVGHGACSRQDARNSQSRRVSGEMS